MLKAKSKCHAIKRIPFWVKKEDGISRTDAIQTLKSVGFNLVAKIYGPSSYEKISLSRNYFKVAFNWPVLTNIRFVEVKPYTCLFRIWLGSA